MSRLPIPGSDKGVWGDILNEYLGVSHNHDGSLKSGALDSANVATKSYVDSGLAAMSTQMDGALTPTSVKTANYTASRGDYVPMNAVSGNVTITLPTAPIDKSRVAVKLIDLRGTNMVSVATGAGDVFNKSSGVTVLALSSPNQQVMMQYEASAKIWYVTDSLSQVSLDGRYGFGVGSGRLSNWFRKLASDPATAKILLTGDSTSTEANDLTLYPRLRNYHTAPGQGLSGMSGDVSHIIDGGNNGWSLAAFLNDYNTGANTASKNLTWVIAQAPDLIILSYGLNDIRNLTDVYQPYMLTSLLSTVVSILRNALPNTDIVLRIPNGSTTDNTSGLNFVTDYNNNINPAGAAQNLTTKLRNAYLPLADVWPNVVLWDAQMCIFGTKSVPSTANVLFANQIHPSSLGYTAIADYLVSDVIGRAQGHTPTTFGNALGDAISTTTRTPWTVDAASLDDTNRFQVVLAGEYISQTATTLLFSQILGSVDLTQGGDIIRLPDDSYCLVNGGGRVTQASGGAVPNAFMTGLTVPSNTVTSGMVRVYREIDQGDPQFNKLRLGGGNRFVRLGRIQGGGTNYAIISAEPAINAVTTSGQWPVRTSDTLYLVNGNAGPVSVALTAYGFLQSGVHLQLSGTTRDFTNDVGKLVLIVGSHPDETTGDHLWSVSVAAGTVAAQSTADVAVTYTGARFSRPYTAVIAQPQVIPAVGVSWTAFVSAADTVTIRFCNPTAAGVTVGTINFDLWLVR